MIVNKKVTGKAKPIAVGLAIGCLVSILISVLGAAITANLVLCEKMQTEGIGYAAVIILLMASACGAWLAAALVMRRRLLVCLGVGGSYYAALLAITALFFGGQYQGMGVTALVVLGGCGAVGLFGLAPKKKTRNRRKNFRFR